MRNLAAAVAIALVSAIGISAPVAAAMPISSAKVVIIVGATHGTTPAYRADADETYAAAIKYTSHVTKIYSPNATWSKVKAAVKGANIVVYYGHGNGWPSPYGNDATYSTKDGFGLNADLNGDGKLSDYENKYYGEPYMAQLGLAPNAIVLLGHLCYASGNSESGNPQPTVSVAHQRIDNYAAGFIKGGARAVIADGHMGPTPYIHALFTTGQSIVDLWRSMPNYHGHEVSFASTRTPGYTDWSDPEQVGSNYYRSLVTKPTLTTTAVTNVVGDTGADPTSLVVPGRAEVAADATPLLATAATSTTDPTALDLPAGTRLKTVAIAAPATTTRPAIIQVEGLDDPTITGFVSADRLAPKDSRAPVVIGIDSGAARFSPNGDGQSDTQSVSALFSESVDWTFSIGDQEGNVLHTASGNGNELTVGWDGLVAGVAVPDGTYRWTVDGTDAWQNGVGSGTGLLVVDTSAPTLTGLSPDGSTVTAFSPNGDGAADTVATGATTDEAGSLVVRVADAGDATVRTFTVAAIVGANGVTWDGRNDAGGIVADGDYTITIAPRDVAGNTGGGLSRPVRVVTVLGFVRNSTKVFYPQDLDRFAGTTTLSFALTRPATVTWTLRNTANEVILTRLDGVAEPAGPQTWAFDGRLPDGTMLPRGIYTSVVSATDGSFSDNQAVQVQMNAFAITPSTRLPIRGHRMTITVVSAEALSTSVRLYIREPGLTTWVVTMTKVASRTYRTTITLKKGGSAGTVRLNVWARDYDGRSQATSLYLHLG